MSLSRPVRAWCWLPVAAVVLASCSGSSQPTGAAARQTSVTPTTVELGTTTTTTTTTTTLELTTTLAPEPPPPPGLGPGDVGPAVQNLEQRLDALRYEVGDVDGIFDQDTAYGVMAFQKVNNLDRSGRATDDVVAAVNASPLPPPVMVPGGGANRVEIDLNRQVLFLVEGDALARVLNASTGSGERFCSEGYCRRAITNPGAFRIYSKRSGWETSPLGRLYNSQYFDGGIAIHGARSVPAEPASHGCVRIPMNAAEWFPDRVALGTPVYVAGDDGPPAPIAPEPPPMPSPVVAVAADAIPNPDAATAPTLVPPLSVPPYTPVRP